MLVLCACHAYRIDPEHATYVKNGVPMCSPQTCHRVQVNNQFYHTNAERNERIELNLRRIPYFDEEEI